MICHSSWRNCFCVQTDFTVNLAGDCIVLNDKDRLVAKLSPTFNRIMHCSVWSLNCKKPRGARLKPCRCLQCSTAHYKQNTLLRVSRQSRKRLFLHRAENDGKSLMIHRAILKSIRCIFCKFHDAIHPRNNSETRGNLSACV